MISGRTGSFFIILLLLAGENIQPVYGGEDIVDAGGCVIESVFEADWRKHSGFNPAIEPKSWAMQQYEAAQTEIRKINEEIAVISAHMELDSKAREEARDLEKILTKTLQANLLRSFWRLAWITYNTIGGPTGKTGMIKAGRSYAELFTEKITVASVSKMLGVVKKFVPKQYSKLPGNEGRVVNVGVDALLDLLKNSDKSTLERVVSAVNTVLDTGGNEYLKAKSTAPDITPEDVAILRTQYIDKNRLKDAIAASLKLDEERRARLKELDAQARGAADKTAKWEKTEKQRVFSDLNKNCRKGTSLQFSLFVPTRVTAGEIVDVIIKLPPGRNRAEFIYGWAHGGELLVNDSLNARFQSVKLGSHPIRVQFFDKENGKSLGILSASIEVVAAQTATSRPAAGSGPARIKITRLTVKPSTLMPGEIVEFDVTYLVSGLPENKKVPVTIRFSGQDYDKTLKGNVINGNFTGWHKLPTNGWKPGRYVMQASVTMPGASDSTTGEFVIRQPDVAVVKPPPSGPAPATKADDFVGDWEGTGTVTNVSGIEGWRRGSQSRMKVRITREGGAYQVYDLMDPGTLTVPMDSKVTGNSVVFYYKGPAIDTRGYAHYDMPVDVSWTLTRTGSQISGNFVLNMEDGNVTMYIQARRAR